MPETTAPTHFSPTHFSDYLVEKILEKRSTVCVGLDPRWDSLPQSIRTSVDASNLQAVAQATGFYCKMVIDAVAAFAPVVKPQAAFFEQLGHYGMSMLSEVVAYARQAGLVVLLDGKRGDIGSTALAYAEAYLGQSSPWGCDALTVNPFLGTDTLQPFLSIARERGAGIFVLVKTSNPGSGFLQDQFIEQTKVYERIGKFVQESSAACPGRWGYGDCGAVVGATYPEQLRELRALMPNSWILIPGYGAQGGSAQDVLPGYDRNGMGAIVNSSRGIIFAYQQKEFSQLDWQEAVARAAEEMRDQLPRPD